MAVLNCINELVPIHPMSPLSKIFWMRHEEPKIFKQTAMFADLKHTYCFNYMKDSSLIIL